MGYTVCNCDSFSKTRKNFNLFFCSHRRLSRKHVLYKNTQFACAQYYPSGVQILATGTDRRISYWEVYDASFVREVEASTKGPINCISLNVSGAHFVSVGNDQIVKVFLEVI